MKIKYLLLNWNETAFWMESKPIGSASIRVCCIGVSDGYYLGLWIVDVVCGLRLSMPACCQLLVSSPDDLFWWKNAVFTHKFVADDCVGLVVRALALLLIHSTRRTARITIKMWMETRIGIFYMYMELSPPTNVHCLAIVHFDVKRQLFWLFGCFFFCRLRAHSHSQIAIYVQTKDTDPKHNHITLDTACSFIAFAWLIKYLSHLCSEKCEMNDLAADRWTEREGYTNHTNHHIFIEHQNVRRVVPPFRQNAKLLRRIRRRI